MSLLNLNAILDKEEYLEQITNVHDLFDYMGPHKGKKLKLVGPPTTIQTRRFVIGLQGMHSYYY